MTDTTLTTQVQIALNDQSNDINNDISNLMIKWFNDLWSGLHVIEADVYHTDGGELLYYNIVRGTKYIVFYRDDKNGIFLCDHNSYWSRMGFKFKMGNFAIFNPPIELTRATHKKIEAISSILIGNALSTPDNMVYVFANCIYAFKDYSKIYDILNGPSNLTIDQQPMRMLL